MFLKNQHFIQGILNFWVKIDEMALITFRSMQVFCAYKIFNLLHFYLEGMPYNDFLIMSQLVICNDFFLSLPNLTFLWMILIERRFYRAEIPSHKYVGYPSDPELTSFPWDLSQKLSKFSGLSICFQSKCDCWVSGEPPPQACALCWPKTHQWQGM